MNKKQKTTNILFCGIGGQGVLTMAEAVSRAAVLEGYHTKKSEVHGMAQRGGSVESHVRFGEQVFSPLAAYGDVDYLVCLFAGEHDRMKGFLKHDGKDLFEYLDKVKEITSAPKYLNSAMLGVLAAHLTISMNAWEKTFEIMFANKNLKENLETFKKGYNLIKRG